MPLTDSPRGRLRAAIIDLLESRSEVEQPELIRNLVRQIADDPDWRDAMLADALTPVVRTMVAQEVASRRRLGLSTQVMAGTAVFTPRQLDAFVARRAGTFETWLEHVGDRNMLLLDMTRNDLHQAAVERARRGLADLHVARLAVELANGLDSDTQKVGEKYSSEDVARLAVTVALPATGRDVVINLLGPAAPLALGGL